MGMAPFLLNGLNVRAMNTARMAQAFSCAEIRDRVLVIVQMHGGNDGANMIIPVDQHADYMALRPNIGISDTGSRAYIEADSTLPLAQQFGFHPDMQAMKDMYDDGLVNVVQGVNYDNSNKSHFKASNLWLTGGDSTPTGQNLNSGWFGRYLGAAYPNFPNAYPNPYMLDPIGLEFGSKTLSLGFHRQVGMPIGLALSNDPTDFYDMVSGIGGAYPGNIPITRYGEEMQYLIDVQRSSDQYGQRLNDVYNAGANMATYPTTYHTSAPGVYYNQLSPQLKTVARLISGGSATKVYLVRITGFDTHTNQVVGGDPSMGQHATLMYHLSVALKAFQDDLRLQGLENKVLTVTFSEFGRQVGENANNGTDHGTLAPMFVIGRGVNPGASGDVPDFTNLNGNDFNSHQFDYRQIYTTVLQDWLGAGGYSLQETGFDGFSNQQLDLINPNYDDGQGNQLDFICDSGCYDTQTTFPVGLLYFNALVEDQAIVRLNWATGTELNNSHFEIERSVDGIVFEQVVQIPGAGNSSEEVVYTTTDEHPMPNVSYYRLKQVDLDGTFAHHGIVEIRLEDSDELQARMEVYPNPARDQAGLSLRSSQDMPAQIRLYSLAGHQVMSQDFDVFTGMNHQQIKVNHLSPGIYVVEVIANPGAYFGEKRLGTTRLLVL